MIRTTSESAPPEVAPAAEFSRAGTTHDRPTTRCLVVRVLGLVAVYRGLGRSSNRDRGGGDGGEALPPRTLP